MFGTREQVTETRYLIGAATGWGGLPSDQAMYFTYKPEVTEGAFKIDVPKDVPADAFWSISVYNTEGFFQENEQGSYSINSLDAEPNADGFVTVHLGGYGDGRVNCIPIMDGFDYTGRLYQPHQSVIDGTWSFPDMQPAG